MYQLDVDQKQAIQPFSNLKIFVFILNRSENGYKSLTIAMNQANKQPAPKNMKKNSENEKIAQKISCLAEYIWSKGNKLSQDLQNFC